MLRGKNPLNVPGRGWSVLGGSRIEKCQKSQPDKYCNLALATLNDLLRSNNVRDGFTSSNDSGAKRAAFKLNFAIPCLERMA
jgi:hypothetical protein